MELTREISNLKMITGKLIPDHKVREESNKGNMF